ncbi:hypothetical protein CRUP_025152 [Coryphaenoides rupestris]|nr:hypothetical protein CRUP_025152 [Coryphaenoides rupestris]
MANAVRLNPTVSLHRLRELTCEQCGQLFYTELQLERHQRLHSNDGQPLPRGATSSSSSTPHHVDSHKVGPQRKGFIPCSVCGRTFTTPSGLRLHSVVHNKKPKSKTRSKTESKAEQSSSDTSQDHTPDRSSFRSPRAPPPVSTAAAPATQTPPQLRQGPPPKCFASFGLTSAFLEVKWNYDL